MTEPTDDLQQRCAEIVEWQRTGVLTGNALRNYAATHWAGRHDSLQMAERDTSAQAMQWIAKWGTPPVAGEPFCYVSVNKQGDITRTMKRKDKWTNIPLYTTPQHTQAQAGAVPLTPDQVAEIADAAHREYDRLVSSGQCAPRWSAVFAHVLEMHHGIKGGQHGTDT